MRRLIGLAAAAGLLAGAATTAPADAGGDYGPNTCLNGFVWREASSSDLVCVTPDIRAQARLDNSQAAARRSPNGGPYGPDTCLQGYVWREAFASDRVCVTPATREQARSDNAHAAERRNELRTTVRVSGGIWWVYADRVNVGRASLEFYRRSSTRPVWRRSVNVQQSRSAPGGSLRHRTGVTQCSGARNAYFQLVDGSSGRKSGRVLICARP